MAASVAIPVQSGQGRVVIAGRQCVALGGRQAACGPQVVAEVRAPAIDGDEVAAAIAVEVPEITLLTPA